MKSIYRYSLLVLSTLFFSLMARAQSGTITGKVTGSSSKEPLERASVFLNNATYGTATRADGTFTISGVKPGQYDLVVSSVGYDIYSQSVLVGKEPINLSIQLTSKVAELREVVITTPEGWKRNYEMFVKYFIGTGLDARKCKILNPHDLYLNYHKRTKILEASSDDFIIIENTALGYREKVLLQSFKYDGNDEITQWSTRAVFEDMKGSASQKKKWLKRRDEVFYGYNANFFRSLMAGMMDENGFEIRRLIRKPNKLRPPEKLIQTKMDHFKTISRDSFNYWVDKYQLPKYNDSLIRRPMRAEEVVRRTDIQGVYAIVFPECLYVTYKNRYETDYFKDVYHPLDMEGYEATVVTLYGPYALFDANGSIVSAQSALFEGSWTKNKGAELLPLDFLPAGRPPVLRSK